MLHIFLANVMQMYYIVKQEKEVICMAKTATMTIRLDPAVKSEAEEIYSHYGMSLTEAITVFFHKSLAVRGLPFDLRPSAVTVEAMREVEDMKRHPENYKGYKNAQEMFDEILSEED
jgi:DNA-damage-inducible protein J